MFTLNKPDVISKMNKLDNNRRAQILHMLVEGSSLRSTARVIGVSINTVVKLLIDAGEACSKYHEKIVRNLESKKIQCDEIWSFCYAKQRNVDKLIKPPEGGAGDVWTWTALDSDSKLIISYLVGNRDSDCAIEFITDVKSRITSRVQLTTDGHRPYLVAIQEVFGDDIDYAQLVKIYGKSIRNHQRAVCTGVERRSIIGNSEFSDISTSYVERQNLTMRMCMRRFTRLTNAFSKKLENHISMLSLFFVYYNFCRVHTSLKTAPAVAANLSDSIKDMHWIVDLINQNTPKLKLRGPYKKSNAIQSD